MNLLKFSLMWLELKNSSGSIICIAAAFCCVMAFHANGVKPFLPLVFIPIIAIVAQQFGTWSGVIGTVAVTVIFAEFLFEPLHSLRVSDPIQRNHLVWMFIIGMALSEILGVRPRDPTRGSKSM